MYKNIAQARDFAEKFRTLYHDTDVKTAIFAPIPQIPVLKELFSGTGIGVGAQNVHFEKEGAFTGEVSVPMLKELGADYCLVGHSERRQYFGETDKTVNLKLKALIEGGILSVVCVGENLDEREGGIEEKVVAAQISARLQRYLCRRSREGDGGIRTCMGHRHRQDRYSGAGESDVPFYKNDSGRNVRF